MVTVQHCCCDCRFSMFTYIIIYISIHNVSIVFDIYPLISVILWFFIDSRYIKCLINLALNRIAPSPAEVNVQIGIPGVNASFAEHPISCTKDIQLPGGRKKEIKALKRYRSVQKMSATVEIQTKVCTVWAMCVFHIIIFGLKRDPDVIFLKKI